jgi:hypothetical protein
MPDINKEYASIRDSLISKAVKYANGQVGSSCLYEGKKAHFEWTADWNRLYHKRMNYLYARLQEGK